jgi:hypothetical protein
MRCRERNKKPGDVFPVRDSFHYALPKGLKDGTLVKLLSFDHGYWTVAADGQQFEVFAGRIDAGMEYELNGRWFPPTDPRIRSNLGDHSLKNSPVNRAAFGSNTHFH